MSKYFLICAIFLAFMSCQNNIEETTRIPETYTSLDEYVTPLEMNSWLTYTPEKTTFKIWAPTASEVRLHLYENGTDGMPFETIPMVHIKYGKWLKSIDRDLNKTYYTYQIKHEGQWLAETPGIYAQAVGVNGKRAMVLDMNSTNPANWTSDKGPTLTSRNDAIIYELHIRDMTIHPQSGSSFPGKYKGLVEAGTNTPEGISTAIDHLKELGINYVHLLPTYDHYSIDETDLETPQFNWGYDPQNYNVPEGSFSTDPFNAEVRIREFKEMVSRFHESGIGVILDVVYNHTGIEGEGSNFNLEFPNYYYRQFEDGTPGNASACGNETASDREMMRQFILESVTYWAQEYHIDGFRFDLMGIHDIETMNKVTEALSAVDPSIFVYGEGWTAGDSPLPIERRALKAHIQQMPDVAAFSDDIRDGVKGSVFEDDSTGFVSGALGMEESIKFGVVGSIQHPDINYEAVNYSDAPWANEPWQAINYVSCHDNHTLFDKLVVSRPDAKMEGLIAMDKLAQAIVFTSQGVPFLHAGSEMLRTKNGEHNSYKSPDNVNQLDYSRKETYSGVLAYYQNLIKLRKEHPAFRMPTAQEIRKKLSFTSVDGGLVSFEISDHANNDTWKDILVVYNATTQAVSLPLEGSWNIAVKGDDFDVAQPVDNTVEVPEQSMMVFYRL